MATHPTLPRSLAPPTDAAQTVCVQEESFCPVISFSKIVLEEGGSTKPLNVTIEALIQKKSPDILSSSWFEDDVINKHLYIKVVQSTNVKTTKLIKSKKGEFRSLGNIQSLGSALDSRERSISEVLREDENQYKTIDTDGNTIWNIPIVFNFEIEKKTNLKHLSYFAFSYFDFSNLGSDFNIPPSLNQISGQIKYRTVIDDGLIRGASDTVIQDFRSVERLEDLDLLPDLSENRFLLRAQRTNLLTNDNLDIVRNSAYFSDFLVSRDRNGAARFFFSVDFRKLILENTVFGKYFVNVPESTFDNIMSRTKIRSLKIKRRRVVPLPGENKLGGATTNEKVFDKNEPEDIIVFTSDSYGSLGQSIGRGTIREVNVTPDLSLKHIRNFTGVDLDVAAQTYGHFQYGVELEVEDGTIDFFVEKYNQLLKERGKLNEYINILNIPPKILYNSNRINLQQEYNNKVLPVINKYFDIVNDLFVLGKSRQFRHARRAVLNSTNFTTRDSKGILAFSKLVDNFLKKLESTINIVGASMVQSSSERNSAASHPGSGILKRSFKVEKYFDELFDSETPKNVGFDYLSVPTTPGTSPSQVITNATGLRTINRTELTDRLRAEIVKYYVNIDINFQISINQIDYLLSTIVNTTSIYLAPSVVRLGNETVSFTDQGVDIWNSEVNNSVAAQILSYKRTGGLYNSRFDPQRDAGLRPARRRAPNSSSSRSEEKIKYYLAKTFDTFNLVLVEDQTSICEEDNHFVPADKFFPGKNKDEQTDTYKDNIISPTTALNPNLFLTRLASGFTLTILPRAITNPANDFSSNHRRGGTDPDNDFSSNTIPNRRERRHREEKFNMNNLDPNTLGNIFNSNILDTSNLQLLTNMPLQLKSIVAAAAGSKEIKYNFSQLPSNPTSESAFVFNYLLLQGVEYLQGYQTTSTSDKVLIKQPIWRIATLEQLESFGSSEVLCRLRKFEHSNLPSIKAGEGLDLPLYDNYFLLTQ